MLSIRYRQTPSRDCSVRPQFPPNENNHMVTMVLKSVAVEPPGRTSRSDKTIFTGDVLRGIQVISHLSLSDVPPNGVTRYYLRTPPVNGGLDIHVPVWVARGPADTLKTGRTLSLSSGVHGDEHNSIRVLQRILKELEGSDCSQLKGTGLFPHS